jgi:hypothetical protein
MIMVAIAPNAAPIRPGLREAGICTGVLLGREGRLTPLEAQMMRPIGG